MSVAHHTIDSVCPLCEQKLLTAHAYMRSWFHQIKNFYPTCHVSWAWRGKEDQEAAFKEGKSKDHWPQSPHNRIDIFGKPESHALDLFQLIDGKAIFDPVFCAKIAAYSESLNLPVFWGGKFKNLGDFDHYQVNLSTNPIGISLPLVA
jgi:hypothetical protein